MSFANPLGLLVLLGALPLVAAYFLRRRQQPRKVSALFLWRSLAPAAAAGPRLERFRRERSLLLELFALFCAALFLANLRCGAEGPRGHLVLVVDGSVSMTAKQSDGRTAIDRVRSAAREEVRRRGAGRLTILEAGSTPRLLAGPEAEVEEALAVLDRHTPAGPDAPLSASLRMGQELAGPGRPFVFFTDAAPPEDSPAPQTLEWIAVGEAQENFGFLSAQRRDVDGEARVTVRVGSFAAEKAILRVRFAPEKGAAREEALELGSGEAGALAVTFEAPGAVTVSLSTDDALAADNRVRLLPAPDRMAGVAIFEGLAGAARSSLLRVISVLPQAKLLGAAVTEEQRAEALSFGPRGGEAFVSIDAPGAQRTFVGPFFTEKSHPLLEDVQLEGVAWTAGDNPPGRALIRAGDAVLMSEEASPAGVKLHLNLELARSNIQRTGAWPVLIGNLLRASASRVPGFARKHLSLGEEIALTTRAGATWVLEGEGLRRPLLGVGALLLPPLSAGSYTLLRDAAPVDELVVLPLDAAESELRQRGSVKLAPTKMASLLETGEGGAAAPDWPLVLLLGAVVANFALTRRTG